jgi:hypothetical protein
MHVGARMRSDETMEWREERGGVLGVCMLEQLREGLRRWPLTHPRLGGIPTLASWLARVTEWWSNTLVTGVGSLLSTLDVPGVWESGDPASGCLCAQTLGVMEEAVVVQ